MPTHVEHVMGMAVSIDVRDPLPREGVLDEVLAWLHHVDATFSTYRADSVVTRLALGELAPTSVGPEVDEVLRTCLALQTTTEGAFDAFAVPAPNGTMLDPSGYVKGWSIERAATILERGGGVNFCINAGGDVALRGLAAPGAPWRVGIRHPDQRDALAAVLELPGPAGVATSATYERGAHIIDPRVGAPTTALASATVVGPDLGMADAFATAVFVMGLDGLAWIDGQRGYAAYVIDHEGWTYRSQGLPALTATTER